MTEKFEDVKLHLDYNRKPLLAVLEDLYMSVLESVLSGPKLIKHSLINAMYSFFHDNMNHMRYRDLFVLYRNFLRRNGEILESGPLDLRLYFQSDYRQFEEKLKEARIFYELFREKDSFKMEKYQNMMQKVMLQIYGIRNYQGEGQTYQELSKRDWNLVQKNEEEADDVKEEDLLKKSADILFGKITKDIENQENEVYFESLKIELSKKGYVNCHFHKQQIVLYNLREDYVNRSQGFLKFKLSIMMTMFLRAVASNIELIVSILVGAIASWNGGFINIVTLGIIIFKILVEQNYGNLHWWKQLYVIYLAKLMLHLVSGGFEKYAAFLNGYSIMADVTQTVLVNHTSQSKIGLSEDHMFNIEDVGQCVVRLIVNQEFEMFVDRMTQLSKSKLELILTYLDQHFSKDMSQEAYRVFKTKCTMAIVSLYLEIEKFKTQGKKSAIRLFTRLKEDVFLDIKGEVDPFIWRNFSQYARKIGADLTGLIYGNLTILIFFTILLLQYSETGKQTIASFFSGTQAISSQTVITITFYIILLFIEKYFNSMTSNDSIGARYNPLFVEFCRNAIEGEEQRKKPVEQESLRDKLKRGVRKISNLARLKPSKRSFEDPFSNPFYYKYYFLIVIWILINFSCYIVQPNTANKGRNGYLDLQRDSFVLVDSYLCQTSSPTCYNYINLPVTKLFYLLNFLYFVIGVMQIRKGKLLAIPEELDYDKTVNTLSFNLYYKTPILREICTLIEYSSLNTTLEIDDWLLVEDLKQYIIEAKISHVTNEIKNTGKTVERNERVTLSWTILAALMGLLIVPLLLFSTFASGDKEQEIISAQLKVELFSNEDGYLMMLYRSNILVDNRVLSDVEKSLFETNPNLMHINRQQMRVLGFSAASDDFLDIEESSKDLLIRQLRSSKNPYVRVFFGFETEDKTFKLHLQDTLRDNMISVLFSKCQFTEKTKSSELFMQMTPQIMEFLTKELIFRDLDPNFTQKFGLSLKCEPNEKKSYVMIMTEGRPTFYAILKAKNEAYEFIMKYMKLDKNLTIVGLYSLIFVGLAISIIRPLIFGQTTKLGFSEMPRNQIIFMMLDAMHSARLDNDLLLEEFIFLRLMDIMRDYDKVYQVTDSTLRYREENLYQRYRSLSAKK